MSDELSAHEKAEWWRAVEETGYATTEHPGRAPIQIWLIGQRATGIFLEDRLSMRRGSGLGPKEAIDLLTVYADGTWETRPGLPKLPRTRGLGVAAFRNTDLHIRAATLRKIQGGLRREQRIRNHTLRQNLKTGSR